MLPVGTSVKRYPGPDFETGGIMNFSPYANSLYAKCGAAERAPLVPALTFPDILSDPMVRLFMKADGVDPKALELELWDIAASLPAPSNPRKASRELCC